MSTVFISYRRGDSSGHTGRLLDSLEHRFGSEAFFRDIESLEYGIDFPAELDKALAACRVMLVMIGPGWLTADANGARRLDQSDDFVRLEVAAALARSDVRTIPVLVGGASMPSSDKLPEDLKPLSKRNCIEISDTRWDYDVGRLGDTLAKAAGLQDIHPVAAQASSTQPASNVALTAGKPASGLGKRALIAIGAGVAAITIFAIAGSGEDDASAGASQDSALDTFEHAGLTWTTDTQDASYDWNGAVAHCEGLGDGWRLPTVAELHTIADANDANAFGHKILRPFHENLGSNLIWSSEADGDAARLAYDFNTLEPTSLAINFKEGAQALCVSE